MSSHVILSGSNREHPVDAAFLGKPAADELLRITLILRRKDDAPKTPSGRLSRLLFEKRHGADEADVETIETFATEHGFSIVRIDRAARSVTLAGKFGALAEAFGADVDLRRVNGKTMRTRKGSLWLHPSLKDRVVAVFGFDQRPMATTRHRIQPRAAQAVSYTPLQVAKAYNFPTNKGADTAVADRTRRWFQQFRFEDLLGATRFAGG